MKEFEVVVGGGPAGATAAATLVRSGRSVDIPIEGGYVGMVDREEFDEWLRNRSAAAGVEDFDGKRCDNGRDVLLAGDAAGIVAPASGEGIYYAMVGGQYAGEVVDEFCATGDARVLKKARRRFLKEHGRVFWLPGLLQRFRYSTDKRRERFVSICEDPDVQRLTWDVYLNKRLVRSKPVAHVRIFFMDLAHLLGIVSP